MVVLLLANANCTKEILPMTIANGYTEKMGLQL
jgi:hypothetical protein